jgi:hypothetical protein
MKNVRLIFICLFSVAMPIFDDAGIAAVPHRVRVNYLIPFSASQYPHESPRSIRYSTPAYGTGRVLAPSYMLPRMDQRKHGY